MHSRGEKPKLLFNTDTSTNNVYLVGSMNAVGQASLKGDNYSVLRPLGTIVVTGDEDTYGFVTTTNPVVVEVSPANSATAAPSDIALQLASSGLALDTSVNNPSFGPAKDTSVNNPAFGPSKDSTLAAQTAGGTIANEIAVGGVPLLTGSKSTANVGTTTIPASSSVVLGTFSLSQIGYELFTAITANAGSTQPGLAITFDWLDTVSGLETMQDEWVLCGSAVAGGQQYMGMGPTKGNQVKITATNFDTAQSASISLVLLQNSRVYADDDWRQLTYRTVPGFTNGSADPESGWLLQANPNVNAGVTAARIMPLYAGQVRLYATSALPFDVQITSFNPKLGLSPNTFTIFEDKITAAGGGFMSDSLQLPNTTCFAFFTNNGGANTVIAVNIIMGTTRQ